MVVVNWAGAVAAANVGLLGYSPTMSTLTDSSVEIQAAWSIYWFSAFTGRLFVMEWAR